MLYLPTVNPWFCTFPVNLELNYMKTLILALAGVAQWTESWPVNQRVTGSIPSQGTRLG